MFKVRPTGPLVPRDPIERLTSSVFAGIQKVSDEGTDITINYTLPSGEVVGFTFVGAPYKGMSIAQIDAALTWEVNEFGKRMGWQ